jgi:autotransporter-associated beta strand protein
MGFGTPAALAQSAFWNTEATGGGSWAVPSNWQGGTVPSGSTNSAAFALDFTSGASVTLDGNRVIGSILSTGANPWNIAAGTGGTLTVANIVVTGGPLTVSTPLAGIDFTKDGSGSLTITNSSSIYTGIINIKSGTVHLVASANYSTGSNVMHLGSGATLDVTQLTGGLRYGGAPDLRLAVNNGDVLDGVGTVKGGLKVKSGGTVYPGFNGVGRLIVEGKGEFEAGSNWKVKLGTANAGASNSSNRIDFTSTLTLAAGMNMPIDGSGQTFNAFQTYDYLIATSAGGLFNLGAVNFQPTNFNPSAFATPSAFSLIQEGNNLTLRFSPVPEPAFILAAGFGVGVATNLVRRRKDPFPRPSLTSCRP